jgi:hypothetical protein
MFTLSPQSVRLLHAALGVTAHIANPASQIRSSTNLAPRPAPRPSPRTALHRHRRTSFLRLFAPANN